MQIRTGTVTVTNNSPVILGSGTAWRNVVLPGAMFLVAGDATPYFVAEVTSDSQAILSAPYQGSTASGRNYWFTTSFTPYRNYPLVEPGDIDAALILSRAIAEIDADLGGGAIGGPATGAQKLGQLADVSDDGADTGEVLTRLSDGSYSFQPAGVALIEGQNLGSGVGLFSAKLNSTLTFRSLNFVGASSVGVTANEITVTLPASGEVNTASNAGSSLSRSLYKQKIGSNLEFMGLREGTGITLAIDGSDIVISATGSVIGGGTTGTAEATTASNLGAGTLQIFRQKTGVNLGFRTITFDATRFSTNLAGDGNSYTIGFVMPGLGDLTGMTLGTPAPGQVLRYDNDNRWKPANLPAAGIANVQADSNPALGGNLAVNGNRIVGLSGGYSGHLEKLKIKTWILDLACPTPRQLASLTCVTGSGTVNVQVLIGGVAVSGLASSVGQTVVILTPQISASVSIGAQVQLAVTSFDALAADFAFTLAYQSA